MAIWGFSYTTQQRQGDPNFPSLVEGKWEKKISIKIKINIIKMNRSTASLARCAFSPRGTRSSAVPLLRTVQRGLATDDQGQPLGGGMFDHLQEIEVVGNSLSKSGGIVEVTARGGGSPLPSRILQTQRYL
jgi:hypothetical protein